MKQLRRPRYTTIVAILVVLLVAVGFTGIAQSTGSSDEIKACVNSGSGALRVVSSVANCDGATETPLFWNVQGLQGIPGPTGMEGPTGTTGVAAVGSGLSPAVAAHLTQTLDKIRSKLNRPLLSGDLATENQQKLQMSMQRIAKAYDTLSDLLRKENATERELLENLK